MERQHQQIHIKYEVYILCGIIGAYNVDDAVKHTLELVLKQKSRGGDGTGIGFLSDDRCFVLKKSVPPEEYNKLFNKRLSKVSTKIAIGHNRAATCNLSERHMDKESHPFKSENGNFILIHNGMLRDHEELRRMMISVYGHKFSSGVDSEIYVHMLEDLLLRTKNRYDALSKLYPLTSGNIIILFNDGEMVGIPDSSFNILVMGNKVFIASQLDTFTNLIQEANGEESASIYVPDSYFASGCMVSIKMENGSPVIRFVGKWKESIIKQGKWIGTDKVMCDFCRESKLVMRYLDKNLKREVDKCLDCYLEKRKVPLIPYIATPSRLDHERRLPFSTPREDWRRSSEVRCKCNVCKKWYFFNEILVCENCNDFMCIICFMDLNHVCKSAIKARSEEGPLSLYPWYVPSANTVLVN